MNERGKKDAPAMAQRLRDKKIKIDAFISSPAKRAKKTARFFAEVYKKDKDDIIFCAELYGAGPQVFFTVIAATKNKFDSIAVFSHNPGITDFANLLTVTKIDDIPTCGVFAVKADCSSWENFKDAKKDFYFFCFPKDELLS